MMSLTVELINLYNWITWRMLLTYMIVNI